MKEGLSQSTKGHLSALCTMLIWGTTFIATKVLLRGFEPVEILLFRFLLALIVLLAAYPRRMQVSERRHELYFAGAGLSGICLYYLLENIALTYTTASNVGVLLAVAPFFTALAAHFFLGSEERLTVNFFVGFVIALMGIALISFNGSRLRLNPLGDFLAIIAAMIWAVYSLCTRKIAAYGYPTIPATRRMFFYGILFMLPALFFFDFHWNLKRFAEPVYLLDILFLGVGASATCFVSWNFAVKCLGIVKSSVYIYIGPVITVIAAALILQEKITPLMVVGTILTLAGTVVSEGILFRRRQPEESECRETADCEERKP